ncbi:hypothetical protein [Cupriavidus agavae]|uniref:Uncharacterized protein n=1 Tax=Cupriavidus agavae TaxID=1001822 RepID=A0A4Q7RRN1_9BURK|nr:hypothetical protein [Cupriavidus agavae]RZT35448.1 hypothetical protein EV147_3889 [Cupriavidus agavae]
MVRSALRDAVMISRYIDELQAKVAAQRRVIAELELSGQDSHHASAILVTLEGALAALEQRRRNAEISAQSGGSPLRR